MRVTNEENHKLVQCRESLMKSNHLSNEKTHHCSFLWISVLSVTAVSISILDLSTGYNLFTKTLSRIKHQRSFFKYYKLKSNDSPSLIHINYEYHIISETGQSMSCGHRYDESKEIIDESIECLQVKMNKANQFCSKNISSWTRSKSNIYVMANQRVDSLLFLFNWSSKKNFLWKEQK